MVIRNINPPTGSAIWVTQDDGAPVVTIPQPHRGPSSYFAGAFLLFWLGGWTFGFFSALSQVLSGNGQAFLIFWLGAWTVGGVLVMTTIYRIFRPAVPERLTLGVQAVGYDSGIPPFRYDFNSWNRNRSWSSYFPKRTVMTISRQDMRSLRLRESDSGNRLTVDVGSARVDLASGSTEVEREWLYHLLAEKYSVPAV